MPVEIKIYGETAAQTLHELSELSAYLAPPQVSRGEPMPTAEWPDAKTAARMVSDAKAAVSEFGSAGHVTMPVSDEIVEEAAEVTKRERGKPSPGKARRTKEEIAEDEAADAADEAKHKEHLDTVEDIQKNGFHGTTTPSNISTGEERINPEEEAQDAADEAAETERNGGMPARERLRKALGSLGIKAGVEAVKPGGLIGMTIDQVPEDQIEAMIAKIEAAKTAPVEEKAKEPEVKPATKDDLMQAMLDYAEVFDGTRNPAEAKLAQVDAGEVFKMLFGEGVSKLSAVPADGYDKAIAGIKEAIEKNPFKRERKG
jgi:hypothetical protein